MSPAKIPDPNRPIYVISIAAELAGVHPQTLRLYERKGLVEPGRTSGNSRRYSERDIEILRRIQELTNEGLNLAGVMRVMALEEELVEMQERHDRLLLELEELREHIREAIEARDADSLVLFRDVRRVRRAMKADALDRGTGKRAPFVVPPAPREDR
jgi:MerR family transcriptional regulator/heat shock protein HspR